MNIENEHKVFCGAGACRNADDKMSQAPDMQTLSHCTEIPLKIRKISLQTHLRSNLVATLAGLNMYYLPHGIFGDIFSSVFILFPPGVFLPAGLCLSVRPYRRLPFIVPVRRCSTDVMGVSLRVCIANCTSVAAVLMPFGCRALFQGRIFIVLGRGGSLPFGETGFEKGGMLSHEIFILGLTILARV